MAEDKKEGEYTGGNVNYYLVKVDEPKRLAPYQAEAEDIIEALGMTFAEGCAFKAIWRSCAMRTLGHQKRGMDAHGVYDAEKVQYYGARMVAQRKKLQLKDPQTAFSDYQQKAIDKYLSTQTGGEK